MESKEIQNFAIVTKVKSPCWSRDIDKMVIEWTDRLVRTYECKQTNHRNVARCYLSIDMLEKLETF